MNKNFSQLFYLTLKQRVFFMLREIAILCNDISRNRKTIVYSMSLCKEILPYKKKLTFFYKYFSIKSSNIRKKTFSVSESGSMATEYPPNEHYEVMTHREDRVSYLQEQIRLQILFNFHRALDLFLIVFKLVGLGLKTRPIEWS